MLFRSILTSFVAMAGCVEAGAGNPQPDPVSPSVNDVPRMVGESPPAVPCATPPSDAWTGAAGRVNQQYPDDVAADVVWTRVSTTGCVDRFAPSGTIHYTFAVPGAQCSQDMTPGDHAIGAADGFLEIDRSTSPATYTGRGATTWTVTWSCHEEDGVVETQSFEGGGVWFDASGSIGDRVEGTRTVDDGRQCGRGQSSLPCDYAWGFDPGAP